MLLIGSEPADRYEGYEAITDFYRRAGASVVEIKVDSMKAYSEGPCGWVVDQVTARLPNGLEVPVRHTYLFHQEENKWKMVHAHISVAIPDKILMRIFKRESNIKKATPKEANAL